jgi:glycosyltransferase involved in cell wall biosynthesis
MKLLIVSHKPCWASPTSPTAYATDGGFPFHVETLSELFDETTLVVPCFTPKSTAGEISLKGHNLSIVPLPIPAGTGFRRKINMLSWLARNLHILIREVRRADAVHTPIPSDIGTIGMLLTVLMQRPLFVRHCGNWLVQRTTAERFWKWFMERFAGGRNVMLATGGGPEPPSERNPDIKWIFSTSLSQDELSACRSGTERRSTQSLKLIIACRQEQEKGTGVVIESLPYLIEDFPTVTLDVVGDGSSLEKFKTLAESLAVRDRVTFHGKVDHQTVLTLLRRADLFCYPTRASEGFPKVVLEAMATGLPVITTRVSVLQSLVGYGCGVLINEATPRTVAEAVRACLRDQEKYRTMSASALRTASGYSLERWRETIGDLLRKSWGPLQADA